MEEAFDDLSPLGYVQRHDLRALVGVFRAMIEVRMGRREEANKSIRAAEPMINRYLPDLNEVILGAYWQYWHIWLIADILHGEAKELIGDGTEETDAVADVQANTRSDQTAK